MTLEFLLGTDGPGIDEIRLDLALPRGSVVTGYALDVGGTLIPGVLLEQPRARNVYQDEVREGHRPRALPRLTGEDRFATRVFPVTPTMPSLHQGPVLRAVRSGHRPGPCRCAPHARSAAGASPSPPRASPRLPR